MNKPKEKLFSVTLDDCEVQPYRGSGAGGQHRNKTDSAIRIVHIASGAVGQCENHRSQHQNKQEAFRRMFETKTFQDWMRIETARVTGQLAEIEKKVDKEMKQVKIEIKQDGKWSEEKIEIPTITFEELSNSKQICAIISPDTYKQLVKLSQQTKDKK